MSARPTDRAPGGLRFLARLLGEDPRALPWLLAPTLLALAMDLGLRGRVLLAYSPSKKLIYASSLLVSAGLWALPLWLAGRLVARARTSWPARGALALLVSLVVLPFATLGFGAQAVHFRIFHAYAGRDTLRLGIALRGTVRDWLVAWGAPSLLLGAGLAGIVVVALLAVLVVRVAPRLAGTPPLLLPVLFVGALLACAADQVDSRFLQAATPDACFAHGVVRALRVATLEHGGEQRGVSLRTPAPLPALASSRRRKPDLLVILTESVRDDVLCSETSPGCSSPFLDEVAPDRIALGKLTTQAPNTFSATMILLTGLGVDASFAAAHTAPVLWELGRAVGYRTFYVSSQNPFYEDFGAYVQRAGLDVTVTARELGDVADEQLGAPDEHATQELLRQLGSTPAETPYLAVLHLSNTHSPYRTDPALEPFAPHAHDLSQGRDAFFRHYRNSVRLQERTVAAFLAEVRQSPRWENTVVVFLSDHGEQFREHGGLYHNHSLYDEELRVPGFLVAGEAALSADELASLRRMRARRTFTGDIHATLVDLLGLHDARGSLPLASQVHGRSLLRPNRPIDDPMTLLATSTSVWEADDPRFGVMYGEHLLLGAKTSPFRCFELLRDPGARSPVPLERCVGMPALAREAFAREGVPAE